MATFEVIADNGQQTEVDEIFREYLPAYNSATLLSKTYLYVAIYKNNKLIEEFGPNENAFWR